MRPSSWHPPVEPISLTIILSLFAAFLKFLTYLMYRASKKQECVTIRPIDKSASDLLILA
jgi:hypothetical protein